MKNQLQNAFKPSPERFCYCVHSAINEAMTRPVPEKKRFSKGWRIITAAVLLAALIPTAVYGAGKLRGFTAKPVNNYGLELGIQRDASSDYPQYVKMHIEIPEGFAEVPDSEGTKFYSLSADEPYTDGFSVIPIRCANEDQKAIIANVDSYRECVVSGHQAFDVSVKNAKGTWNQLYVYFDDVNVMLLIYHKDVTDEQINAFVGGISFTEGSESDHTVLNEPYDERQNQNVSYKDDETFIELPLDTKLTCKAYSQVNEDESLRYTAQITDIRITDNIGDLDSEGFNCVFPPSDIADTNGALVPKEYYTFSEGDGFTSSYEELSREMKNQKMILAEITYENHSDEDIALYIPYSMNVMNKDEENSFTNAETIDAENRVYSSGCCDHEITYLSPCGKGKSFCILTLSAHDTVSVTVGFRCNADMLDKAYLSINGISDILEPSVESNSDYTVYLFKVQGDDR